MNSVVSTTAVSFLTRRASNLTRCGNRTRPRLIQEQNVRFFQSSPRLLDNNNHSWRIAPYPDIPEAYADQQPNKIKMLQETEKVAELESERVKKREHRSKPFRMKKNPFDSSNRPIAEVKIHEVGKRSGGLSKPVGWVGAKGKLAKVDPPDDISATLNKMLKGEFELIGQNFKLYMAAGAKLRRFLAARKLPNEGRTLKKAWDQLEFDMRQKHKEAQQDAESDGNLFDKLEVETNIQKDIRKQFHAKVELAEWKAVDFEDRITAWSYIIGKSAFDYAALKMVLAEVREESFKENFRPRTLFDFGSGVGTAYWAVNEMFGKLNEAVFVDESVQMQSIAKTILMKGKSQDRALPAGHFFRREMTKDHKLKYDIVTCAFTLSEIPSERERWTIVTELWMKTAGYLVIVDSGSNAGFQAVAEARNLLTSLSKLTPEAAAKAMRIDQAPDSGADPNSLRGHLFAPCPHEKPCPRYENDTIPCNFKARYTNFNVDAIPKQLRDMRFTDNFSYVVFKKGETEPTNQFEWHRLVREPIINKKSVICQLCTQRGALEETYVHKMGNTDLYFYCKKAVLGQKMKVDLKYKDEAESASDDSPSDENDL